MDHSDIIKQWLWEMGYEERGKVLRHINAEFCSDCGRANLSIHSDEWGCSCYLNEE